MSEGTAKGITCKRCNEKVPSGKFCLNCGSSLNTGQAESIDGAGDGPHPPIQVSDASSSSSSGTGTKPLSQQSDASVVGVSPTNNSGSHQSNISTVPTSTRGTTTASTVTETSSYADILKSPKQNAPQNQQANGSLAGDVTTNSDPRLQDNRHRNAREGSRAANGAPENGGNTLYEV